MATTKEQERRKRMMPIVFALIGAAALCLLAMAAGFISSPLLDSWFGGGNGQTSGGGNGGGDAGSGSGNGGGCFLNLICFNASGNDDSIQAEATVSP